MTRFRHLLLLTTALTAFGLAPAAAGPNGATVVGGSATVSNPGSANVVVNQQSNKAIINWSLFNVGTNEKVQFVQPNSGSITLNRVVGGLGPSMILGTIDANGRIFIINRDGILFGPGAVINTAGLLATTHDIRNDDFMAGRFNFNIPGRPDASIVNLGTITATNGGFAALVAPGVRNSGTITATLGTVALASGNGFTLDFYGDKLVTLNVGDSIAASVKDVATGLPLKALVGNDGKIKADGGRVELTAVAARQVVDAVINTSGVIEANTVGVSKGMIVLGAATGATKPAGAPTQTVKISGTLKAAGHKEPNARRRAAGRRQGRHNRRHRREHSGRGRPDHRHRRQRRRQGADRRRLGRRQARQVAGQQSERGARNLCGADRDDGERRCRDEDRRIRHADRQWRQGDPVGRQSAHVRRHDPRARRQGIRQRRVRRDVGTLGRHFGQRQRTRRNMAARSGRRSRRLDARGVRQ